MKKQAFEQNFQIAKTLTLDPESPLLAETRTPSKFVKIVPIFGVQRKPDKEE